MAKRQAKTKVCTKCGMQKPLDEFHRYRANHGVRGVCKLCTKEYDRQWYAKNKVKSLARSRKWQSENRERWLQQKKIWARNNPEKIQLQRKRRLVRQYGLTLEQYQAVLEFQNERCAICGRARAEFDRQLAIDHDSVTGEIRGALCTACNLGLGTLGDSSECIQRALSYLIDPPARMVLNHAYFQSKSAQTLGR